MSSNQSPAAPIGIFDSGVGGLSVVSEILGMLPRQPLVYYADCARAPWGEKPPGTIQRFAREATEFLLARDAAMIVVACHTASVHALEHLRSTYPNVRFVGMHPAVKPAALATVTRKIGVLATKATATGQVLGTLLDQFVHPLGVEAHVEVPRGLVEQVERGELDSAQTLGILERATKPMLDAGVDTIVLACTHFPFIAEALRQVVGPDVQLVNPAPAVARQTQRVYRELFPIEDEAGIPRGVSEKLVMYTSGPADAVADIAARLIDRPLTVEFAPLVLETPDSAESALRQA